MIDTIIGGRLCGEVQYAYSDGSGDRATVNDRAVALPTAKSLLIK